MCWIAHDGDRLRPEWKTNYEEPDVAPAHEQVLAELYGLSPAQVHLYDAVIKIVDEALEQFDKGFAVCIEEQTADLAKELVP